MKRLATIVVLFQLFCGVCLPTFIAQGQKPADSDKSAASDAISGRYEGLVKGPSVGDLYITMEIKNDGGNITGVIVASGSTIKIISGNYALNRLSVKFQVGGSDVVISAVYQDSKLVGNYTLAGETGTVELKRIANEGDASTAINRLSEKEWRDDLHYLASELPKRHKNAFHHTTREQFEQKVAKLDAATAMNDMRLLGVSVIGEQATELVHIGLTALLQEATAELFIQTCFNYPTLSELYKYATYDALGARAKNGGQSPVSRPETSE